MKPGSVIVEIFPYKYYRTSYQALARQFGVHYRMQQNTQPTSLWTQPLRIVSQAFCMHDLNCRSFARGRSVVMTQQHQSFLFRTMQEIELGVLNAQNAVYKYY